jgi:hypothetical protein
VKKGGRRGIERDMRFFRHVCSALRKHHHTAPHSTMPHQRSHRHPASYSISIREREQQSRIMQVYHIELASRNLKITSRDIQIALHSVSYVSFAMGVVLLGKTVSPPSSTSLRYRNTYDRVTDNVLQNVAYGVTEYRIWCDR